SAISLISAITPPLPPMFIPPDPKESHPIPARDHLGSSAEGRKPATRGPRQTRCWFGGVEARGPRQTRCWFGGVEARGPSQTRCWFGGVEARFWLDRVKPQATKRNGSPLRYCWCERNIANILRTVKWKESRVMVLFPLRDRHPEPRKTSARFYQRASRGEGP